MSIGFRDKLYWRQVNDGLYHCFRRARTARVERAWVSLCGDHWMYRSGGQKCSRPEPHARCAACDCAEMIRRGWCESGPASPKEDQ